MSDEETDKLRLKIWEMLRELTLEQLQRIEVTVQLVKNPAFVIAAIVTHRK